MANTPEANLVIATMQKQVMDYNKRRLSLFDSYVQREGHDFGFGDMTSNKARFISASALTKTSPR